MENSRPVVVPVTLKGVNYLLWSRTTRTALCSRGLWNHILRSEAPKGTVQPDGNEISLVDKDKWFQEDQAVLAIIQNSLDTPILEAYSYCETAKELWETLQKVYGNISNLSRVYEVKKAINDLSQEDMEFTKHFGKYRSLWAELEMLRPSTIDPAILNERREQDKVFGLLLTLNPTYNDLIKHLLRAEKLPTLEEVCAHIQKEQGSLGLFGGKGELISANKGVYRHEERKVIICDHCKKKGHIKDKCWLLHPHLKPQKFREPRAHFTHESPREQASTSTRVTEGEMKALIASQQEMVKRTELEALIKALKEAGNSGKTLGNSLHALHSNKPVIVDSGASHHMISESSLINNIQPAEGNVVIANGDKVPVRGIGNLKLFDKESKAFYMPTFTSNLLSIKRATTDLDCYAIFSPNEVQFQDIETGRILGKGVSRDDLYVLEDTKPISYLSCSLSSISQSNNALWHARLGHPHDRALGLLLPEVSFKNGDCEACILGKHCKSVFPKSSKIYENCFDLIHSDVWTSPCASRDQYKYFVTFIDEKSKYTWITLLPSKDRVLEAFMNFQRYVTNQFDAKIKFLRSDNGGEYTSHAFKDHLSKHGIIHQTSCPYTPQQNGVAERKNRHLMEVARSMMFHHNVPKGFWGDAVVTACYLINRTPTKILDDISPFEVLNKIKPSINHLRVFGCVCYVLVPGEQRNKLDAKSTKAMFIGYSTTQKGYKCYVPETRKVLVSRDVKFVENKGFYEERNWDNLKDLSHTPADQASSLRFFLENLNLNKSSNSPAPSTAAIHEGGSHSDHEGGTSSTHSESVHDQNEAVHDQNEEEDAQGMENQEEEEKDTRDEEEEEEDTRDECKKI